jgi:DegV family protein with EDD domain
VGSIALITDSTSDMNEAARKAAGASVVPLQIHFGSETFRDYEDISPDEFLTRLESSSTLPRTSQPSPADFAQAFDAALADHDQVLVVTLSSRLSGTWQSAVLGAAESGANRITIVDSLSASVGLHLQVLRARELIEEGRPIKEIAAALEGERGRYHLLFFADTLDYLQRGGRIGRAGHLIGSLLKVKPILACKDGEVHPWEKTRSRARAIEGLIEFGKSRPSISAMGILHDGAESEDVDYLLSSLKDRFDPGKALLSRYGPTVATHVGPAALGICYVD